MFLQEVPRELYGPVMVVLTMIALLLYQMKSADHKVVRVFVSYGCYALHKTMQCEMGLSNNMCAWASRAIDQCHSVL